MYVHIPESESHPGWNLEEVRVEGFAFEDTLEAVAMTALTKLFEKNKAEMGPISAMYFPFMNQDDGLWKRCVKSVNNKSRVEHDLLVASSSNYMTSMFNLHQSCQREYQQQRELMVDYNMKEAGWKVSMSKYRQANFEREFELENQLRNQSKLLVRMEAELKHAQDLN